MRSPRDFTKPLAMGAPHPVLEIPIKPSRCIHFFDPSNPKMAAKLPELARQTDILLGNLEDAIPADRKVDAREGLVKVGREVDLGDTPLWTRVNSLDSPWFLDDVVRLVGEIGDRLEVVMIPKVEGPWDIHYVDRLLAQLEARHQLKRPLLVHAILETALGVTNVEEICAASPRMQGISFGPADLAASRRMKTTRVGGGHPAYLVRTDPDPKHPDAPRPTAQQDPWHYSIARMVARPEPDRDRQEGVQPAGRGGRVRQARARGDARRARRPHARRQDAGRRHLEAVQGDGDARPAARGQGPGARPPLRLRPMSAGAFFAQHEVHVGQDVGGRALTVSEADVARYERGTGGASARPAGAAPALILHSEVYRSLAWYLPNIFGNLHARQEWELFAPILVGQPIRTRATVVDRYRKRDREYVVNEVLVTDAEGRWLQRSRTHQSFLVEDGGRDTVVDREREKRPERVFTVGEGPGEPIGPFTRPITLAMCEAFSGPAKN